MRIVKKILTATCLAVLLGVSVNAHAVDYSPEDLMAFAQKAEVVTAMKEFSAAFGKFREENGIADLAEMKTSVREYYDKDFANTYKEKTGNQPDIDAIYQPLDDDSIALQYYYVSNNPHPLGEKDVLNRADDKSKWSELHDKYHPLFRGHLQEFELYDVFLVDLESGDIVYSVFKELDFSTSLLDGPYAETPFGEVFRNVREADGPDDADIGFREPYFPSYEADAVFVSAPLFDGDQQVGVLIVQIPFE